MLNKETLRDLTPENARQVKGGGGSFFCSVTCYKHCRWPNKTYNKKCGY